MYEFLKPIILCKKGTPNLQNQQTWYQPTPLELLCKI